MNFKIITLKYFFLDQVICLKKTLRNQLKSILIFKEELDQKSFYFNPDIAFKEIIIRTFRYLIKLI